MNIDFGEMFSRQDFVANCWQKKFQIWRGAAKELACCLDKEAIFEHALDEDLTSRVVKLTGEEEYSLDLGPFDRKYFGAASGKWTVLVQELDHIYDELAALRRSFGFVSPWRFDDVMASYATNGAGVGPHFDSYDVFLVQISGKRRWTLRDEPASDAEVLPDEELKLIRPFSGQVFEVEPGDIIYVPPRTPHWGVSEGESIALSFGFFFPPLFDLLQSYANSDDLETQGNLLSDVELGIVGARGEVTNGLSTQLIAKVKEAMAKNIMESENFVEWLGQELTRPRRHDRCAEQEAIASGKSIAVKLYGFAKITYFARHSQEFLVFCNGSQLKLKVDIKSLLDRLISLQTVKLDLNLDPHAQVFNWLNDLGAIQVAE